MASRPRRPPPRKALGKGLGALLPDAAPGPSAASPAVVSIPVAAVDPNPVQPRTAFDPESLRELAASIRSDGVLQPILVRPQGERYTLIVGERRLKASRMAGLSTVPAILRDFPPDRILEVTLVENIQRENLNPIEIAVALDRMSSDLNLTHEELAARTGMSRTSVTNHIRLLRLPPPIRRFVEQRKLQMGHARALLALDRETDQQALAERAATDGLSAREVERAVRKLLNRGRGNGPSKGNTAIDPNVAAAIEELERVLQAPVRLRQRGATKGCLEIAFSSPDELSAIYDRIVGDNPA